MADIKNLTNDEYELLFKVLHVEEKGLVADITFEPSQQFSTVCVFDFDSEKLISRTKAALDGLVKKDLITFDDCDDCDTYLDVFSCVY